MPDTSIIRVNKMLLPTSSPLDLSGGEFCIKIGAEWASYWIGLLSVMRVRAFWQNTTEEEWKQIQEWIDEIPDLLLDCVECPEVPPTEPPAEPPALPELPSLGASDAGQGTMGMSVEELEELVGMAITKIEYRDGQLWYRDGCCDWYQVSGESGVAVEGATVTSKTKPEPYTSLQEWEDGGQPELPSVPTITYPNTAYTTADSLRCVKASALVEQLWHTLEICTAAAVAYAAAATGGMAAIIEIVEAEVLSGGVATAYFIAAALITALTDFDATEVASQLDDWHSDSSMKADLICTLTGAVEKDGSITALDVKQLLYYFLLATGVELPTSGATVPSIAYAMPKTFPVSYYQYAAGNRFESQECECDNFLPPNYTPNPLTGFYFRHWKFGAMPTSVLNPNVLTNQALGAEDIGTYPSQGVKVGNYAKTIYAGLDTAFPYTHFHWLLELSAVATFSSLDMTWTYDHPDANITLFDVWSYAYDTVQAKWLAIQANHTDSSSPFETNYVLTTGGNLANIKYISVQLYVRGIQSSNTPVYLTATSVKLNGVYGGNPFTNYEISTSH